MSAQVYDEKPVPAPKGAIVLFDGKSLSDWTHTNGRPATWTLADGMMEVNIGSGDIQTKQQFGDFELHLEFWLPLMADKTSQARANSGVFLQGRYEIQVLDSYNNETYAKGECGAIYGLKSPDVNAARPPDHWQTYDVTFRAARFDAGGKKTENARVTVVWNGVKIHDNVEVEKPTGGGTEEDKRGPLRLQDHGNKIRYRNIWIVPKDVK
ncbi:DUF1080 domain-containing protein [Candidatus Poribacteria bacterium]|nr:DUF1080 domain-containing protein [Candidatus Poribacteria bacterium]